MWLHLQSFYEFDTFEIVKIVKGRTKMTMWYIFSPVLLHLNIQKCQIRQMTADEAT